MIADRFFSSTRGRIVAELRERGSASAADLAAVFGLSPNAIRQQLVLLERDGLVEERSVRRGPTKPTIEFSLTPAADKLFPQQYDKMLAAVLREVRELHGSDAVDAVFSGIARRASDAAKERVTATQPEARVAQLADVLREKGVRVDYSLIDGGFALSEHNCPYADVVSEHPEVCSVIHQVIDDTIGPHEQTESLATGGKECRFVISTPTLEAR